MNSAVAAPPGPLPQSSVYLTSGCFDVGCEWSAPWPEPCVLRDVSSILANARTQFFVDDRFPLVDGHDENVASAKKPFRLYQVHLLAMLFLCTHDAVSRG
jgi:hypothetical protein